MEELRGKEYADMLRLLGRQDLDLAITEAGSEVARQPLQLDLTGRDPDAAATDVAYEKGSALLQTIESVVGRSASTNSCAATSIDSRSSR